MLNDRVAVPNRSLIPIRPLPVRSCVNTLRRQPHVKTGAATVNITDVQPLTASAKTIHPTSSTPSSFGRAQWQLTAVGNPDPSTPMIHFLRTPVELQRVIPSSGNTALLSRPRSPRSEQKVPHPIFPVATSSVRLLQPSVSTAIALHRCVTMSDNLKKPP
jgi:hypothetical protein